MLIDERLFSFICSYDRELEGGLAQLEEEALKDRVPIIRKDMQGLLSFIVELKKPRNILEIGTAVGFSALLMANRAGENCHITTIENYDKRIPIARENFRKFGMEERITLIEGDAGEVIKELEGPYDMIFMDAAKGQYPFYLQRLIELASQDGIIVCDNVLQDGDVMESRFAVTRRDRTIHSRMRDFLFDITHNDNLQTVILPTGDGVTLSIKKGNKI